MQATIVALYGDKPRGLRRFLLDCQDAVARALKSQFRRYEIDQIHGTLMGLERVKETPDKCTNLNFRKWRDTEIEMDFGGLLRFLRGGGHLPLQLQIAGFQDRDYPFISRDAGPFERSFSIQGKNVVIMGWPLRGLPMGNAPASPMACVQEARLYPSSLDSMRRGAQQYGVLHNYHRQPEDVDNDFFFRIGMLDRPTEMRPSERECLEGAMRSFLGSTPPLVLDVTLADLHVVFYESEELPLSTSRAFSLARQEVDEAFIRRGFRERDCA